MVTGNCNSSTSQLIYGVPLGSVLGPLVFTIHMLPLGQTFQKHHISFHFYVNDSQIYFSFDSNNTTQSGKIQPCLTEVKNCLFQNFLELSQKNQKLFSQGQTLSVSTFPHQLGSPSSCVIARRRNLRVTFDNKLNFDLKGEV